ncbi:hypothetical protein GA0115240_124234 [Streptomyces sp. DvalAA-14]|uniref:hypothetical protein n=1 Tax=unclassified Streptomyces TaxID=2593676 RepID=UPI00081B3531|nr:MULTISPECIES: hypothetical protein [unclassified Streptomyces]MYS20978.1 hypothetical protein [Streptomyces sp. SID4948]SCD81198.1 hypothetical protein GA0115240_124234 [Streptomyces sp. DvalAA-14]
MRSPLISAAVAAAAVIVLAPVSPASAADPDGIGDVTCHGGSLDVQFNPGVTFSKNTVRLSANGELGNCSSRRHPKITGGTIRLEASLTAQCPGPYGPGYAKATIYWNDGTRTVIDQTTFRGDAQSFSLEGGSIATGSYAGGTARANGRTTSSSIELGAACVSGGLTSYSATIDQLAVGDI